MAKTQKGNLGFYSWNVSRIWNCTFQFFNSIIPHTIGYGDVFAGMGILKQNDQSETPRRAKLMGHAPEVIKNV